PLRPSWNDDDPLSGVGLSREHLPIGGERRVAAAAFIDRSQPRRNVHEGEPGLGDSLPEGRPAPVGDALLAAPRREKALPLGPGQRRPAGIGIPMRFADDDRGLEIIPEMAVYDARHRA